LEQELFRSIRRNELSSVEVTEYFLERIERRNPAISAVVTLDPERAPQTTPSRAARRSARCMGCR
jgi:Asp-tRNA(Asn)/Glu-tRNA(Gln) amidotransferase A subunit family amidase